MLLPISPSEFFMRWEPYPLVGEALHGGLKDQSGDLLFELELLLNDKINHTN
jgi:hypothetical protein